MRVSEEALELKREELGLNDPFAVQYGRWLNEFFHGDLGESYKNRKSRGRRVKENDSGDSASDSGSARAYDPDFLSDRSTVCEV
mgnify:CR=1 FL=1